MDYQVDERQCWQADLSGVKVGCCLELSELEGQGLAVRYLKQVHGNKVLGDRRFEFCGQEADGLISDRHNLALVVRTADCVPIHVTDGQRMAILHAGWRGTEAGIVRELLNYFNPRHASVAIGPAISAANYEVDVDLYGNWLHNEPELEQWLLPSESGGTKRMFNLKGLVRSQLLALGIPENRIALIPTCTFDSSLPSYRRQGAEASRIINYIYKKS